MAKSMNLWTQWLSTTKGKSQVNRSASSKSVSYLSLYRYATPLDFILMTIAFSTCIVQAVSNSFFVVGYSDILGMIVDRNSGLGASSNTIILSLFGGGKVLVNVTHEENMAELRNDAWAFGTTMLTIYIISLITGTVTVDLMNFVGLRIVLKLRQAYFEATIRKDIAWHDVASNKNFALHMTDSMDKIRGSISEKLATFTFLVLFTIASLTTMFISASKLAFTVFGFVFVIIIGNILTTKFQKKFMAHEQSAYMKAGNLAEEIISAIRTVVAFCGENLEGQRYDELLASARKAGKRRGFFSGVGYTLPKSMLFIIFACIIWYGTRLILQDRDKNDREYTPAVVTLVFYELAFAVDNVGRFSPYLDCFAMGVTSAGPIFEAIDSKAAIDPLSADGKSPDNGLKGDIVFRDVFFRYPSRADAIVLKGLNLKVKAGQTVALVGHSGCGKSTCLQLMQRFYDPSSGCIIVDGMAIRKYNVSWLRSNMATVGQEPVLFQGTIGENIRYGKPEATQEDIEVASRAAGAHDFISELPNGYNTSIVEKGVQLSGGQKQRIAIARALISNPTILLLDEATSALDYHSEKMVQEALNAASQGRTTIVVSHRLSATKNADKIFFLHEGKVVEEGSHTELMNLRGMYFEMVKSHTMSEDDVKKADTRQDEVNSEILSEKPDSKLSKNLENKHRLSLIENNTDEDKNDDGQTQFIKTFIRIIKMAGHNWWFLIIATFCAAFCGCYQAVIALIMGNYYETLAELDDQNIVARSNFLMTIAFVIGVFAAILSFTERYLFNLVGVDLNTRLRSLTFKAIISQEINWFDDKQNSVGALSARLSGDSACVQDVISYPLSGLIQATANIISGVSIAFYFSWKMALVCLCTAPLLIGSVIFEAIYMGRVAALEHKILQDISQFATEAIVNIRTVASLRREPQLIADYNKGVTNFTTQLRRSLRFRGFIYANQTSTMFLAYGIGTTYGTLLCSEGVIRPGSIMKVGGVLLYGLIQMSYSLALCPAFISGLIAAGRIFQMVDRKPNIKPILTCDKPADMKKPAHAVKYHNVFFHYPSRPDVRILKGFNLEVLRGKTVAFVGPSGCGKSTLIQLILRYYDPSRGEIFVEGQNYHDLTLTTLRSRLGIVSQEPTLFEKTIADNIAYGDNSRTVTMLEIVEAAKLANAFSFITALPNGFETKLGTRGTQLSGGQKQRIAIARALIRNPQVLLLDEATSALDFESERIVQSALDRAVSGRTSIVIAHRLSTIQNADLICVVKDGVIVEQGNHQQLLAANGLYSKLYESQQS